MSVTNSRTDFTVVISTRNRQSQLERTLVTLERQSHHDFDVIVVDQSDQSDPGLVRRNQSDPRLTLVRDDGSGLSRSRNIGWRLAVTDWVVFLDDDCLTEADWAERLANVFTAHPELAFVSGHVSEHNIPAGDYLRVSVFEVTEERVRSGRWTWPHAIGLGVCMAIRRSKLEELNGFDERFGAGTQDFPAAEDMDFNYRLLKSGGVAFAAPQVRASHDQWRTHGQLGPLYRGYYAAWSGFAMKHFRSGDLAGGLWLWVHGARDVVRMVASALRRRSGLRMRVAWYQLRGLVAGTLKGLTRSW